MIATQVLAEDKSESDAEDEIVSEIVGFIIAEDKRYVVRRGEAKIGRDSALCSIFINNCTVSKVHAVLESEGVDDTFIYDVNSTNQTKLGKKVLKPYCRYKLDHESKLTFGNVGAKFLLPSQSTDSVNLSPLDKLQDIFDVNTQVCIRDTSVSSEIPVFENLQEKSHTFKIPTSLPARSKVTHCKIDSSETKSRTEFHMLENSSIFNLNTQCQICEPSAANEAKTVPNDDSHKSLLNDGQDDLLYTFMSLNSPEAQDQINEKISFKTEVENSRNILDVSTQSKKLGEENELKQEKQASEQFSSSSCKLSISNTPLKHKFMKNQPESESHTKILEEEDFIKTQDFNFDLAKDALQQNVQSQDPESQPYLKDILNDLSIEQINEDLMITQAFENFEKCHQEKAVPNVIPDTKDFCISEEDFMETLIYDVEKEAKRDVCTDIEAHPNKDTKSHFDENLDFAQRNNQGDFIAAQVFKATNVRNEEVLVFSDDDDEDFIATQPVEISVNRTQSSKNSPKILSRESSPDFLSSGNTWNNSEDCISTQIFEVPECQNPTFSKKSDSVFFSDFNTQNKCVIKQSYVPESSDDETESDLEIILEKNETNKDKKSFKTELLSKNSTQSKNLPIPENDNSSYIFELEPENHSEQIKTTTEQKGQTYLSDSDATDCEEIALISPKILRKQERREKIEFEETQVLTLTLPDNFAKNTSGSKGASMDSNKNPTFEMKNDFWNLLSLEIPSTQEVESSVNKNLRNELDKRQGFQTQSEIQKIEVGTRTLDEVILSKLARADSPLKRPLDTNSSEVVSFKKSKTEGLLRNTEKKFSRLVQVHDIAQIQPSRTRNSLKTSTKDNGPKRNIYLRNNITNPPSRRKSNRKKGSAKKVNGDITPYLTKNVETRKSSSGRCEKETSLKENKSDPKSVMACTRILRSSSRFPVLTETPIINIPVWNTKRSSRTSNEYHNNRCVNVVFTGFECESLEKIIFDLGGKKTNDLFYGEVVVVTDKVRLTVKFLCAVGLSLPIVSPEWLLSCKKNKRFLDPWDFILKDDESEEKWEFELRTSLEKSKNTKLLQGFSVFATKSAQPPIKDLLAIVRCCGGTPLLDPPEIWPKKTLVVSCLEDKKWWPHAKLRNVKIVHFEFILSGVLRQKIDFKTYELR